MRPECGQAVESALWNTESQSAFNDARPDWLRREAREARKNHGPQRMA